MARDPHQVLGLPANATAEQIRSAYRQLARQFHPDCTGSPETAEPFHQITEAYNQLLSHEAPDAPPCGPQSVRIRVRAASGEGPPLSARPPAPEPGFRRSRVVAEPLVPPQRRAAGPPPRAPAELSLLFWLLGDDFFRW